MHHYILISSIWVERQENDLNYMLQNGVFLSFVIKYFESKIVPWSFVKLPEVLVAHSLEVKHYFLGNHRVILVCFDSYLRAFFRCFEVVKLKVANRLSKESIRPPSLALFCELEEFYCDFIPFNPFIRTRKIVKQLGIEWELFDSISEIIHAISNSSSFLNSFLCKF